MTPAALDRALLVADALLRAAAEFGWIFDDPGELDKKQGKFIAKTEANSPRKDSSEAPEPRGGRLLVEGEQVGLSIEERFREEAVEPTAAQLARERREYGYRAPRKVSVPTGALRIVRFDTYRRYGGPDRRSWYDRKGKRIEAQLPEVLLGFYELSLSIRERREKDEREEREAIREANSKLIAQLEADAGAWHRARYLRRYIKAARSALGERSLPVRYRDEAIDYLDWAERYVDELDPLASAPRSGEFDESSSYYYHNDLERMREAFGRLLGADWKKAFKISETYPPRSESDCCIYFREKSLFEEQVADADGNDDG